MPTLSAFRASPILSGRKEPPSGGFLKWGSSFAPAFLFDENFGGMSLRRCTPVDWEPLMRAVAKVERDLEARVEDLGYELVELRWGGSKGRPQLQLRIDRPDSLPGEGVNVDDCAVVSRALEAWLDEHEGLSERYVLEVSSPGLDRPLTKSQDFERFRGEKIAVNGDGVLADRATRLEGELLGLEEKEGEAEAVVLRLANGDEVTVPRSKIRKAHLVFTWK